MRLPWQARVLMDSESKLPELVSTGPLGYDTNIPQLYDNRWLSATEYLSKALCCELQTVDWSNLDNVKGFLTLAQALRQRVKQNGSVRVLKRAQTFTLEIGEQKLEFTVG